LRTRARGMRSGVVWLPVGLGVAATPRLLTDAVGRDEPGRIPAACRSKPGRQIHLISGLVKQASSRAVAL
jgi:hypothetical protein